MGGRHEIASTPRPSLPIARAAAISWIVVKWRSTSLPEPVLQQLDLVARERGKSRAKTLAEILREPPRPQHAEMDEGEFRACLEDGVRGGTVGAMQLWASLYLRDEPPEADADPFDEIREQKLKVVRPH